MKQDVSFQTQQLPVYVCSDPNYRVFSTLLGNIGTEMPNMSSWLWMGEIPEWKLTVAEDKQVFFNLKGARDEAAVPGRKWTEVFVVLGPRLFHQGHHSAQERYKFLWYYWQFVWAHGNSSHRLTSMTQVWPRATSGGGPESAVSSEQVEADGGYGQASFLHHH